MANGCRASIRSVSAYCSERSAPSALPQPHLTNLIKVDTLSGTFSNVNFTGTFAITNPQVVYNYTLGHGDCYLHGAVKSGCMLKVESIGSETLRAPDISRW